LASTPESIGFRCNTALDDSPETLDMTRRAVARAKQGDQQAVRFLYVKYSDNIYGYIRSIVRDEHDAEDLTQQVYAKLLTGIAKYDDRGVPFFAWLLRLARNAAIDHLRTNRPVPTETMVESEVSSGADMDRAETLRTALATLPYDQRKVVVLRHFLGLSPGEIADRIGRSEGAVHRLHQRGRRALRRELEELESSPFTRAHGKVGAAKQVVAA
jgi:RNA polymerase sigma-70 factor, ECF subfamily